jgi:hypothetical protein
LAERPLRTRAHWLADLSVNHVERFVLQQGHSAARVSNDYGYDLIVQTFDYGYDPLLQQGAYENGLLYVQVKAQDRLRALDKGASVAVEITQQHLNLWREEPMPVILVAYDGATETAYWIHLQPLLRSGALTLRKGQQEASIRLSTQSRVDVQTVDTWRTIKQEAVTRMREKARKHGQD